MERTEIVSLFKNTPADGTEITVCGWAKNIRDSKNIGFIALSDGGCLMESSPSFTNWQPISKQKRPGIAELAALQTVADRKSVV